MEGRRPAPPTPPPAPAATGSPEAAQGVRLWQGLTWAAFAIFLLTAGLNMGGIHAGFATNYLADLVVPAYLYLVIRSPLPPNCQTWLARRVGATPERAAVLLFLGSLATEVSQKYWPAGLFRGRFDPLDIVAFAVGLMLVYALDKKIRPRA
ncbi:MAG: hypothetical protein IPI38_01440 [Gemmatimonadetes bacterium]|nr:hypothetical protein [Gemmatimonadota bacterium]MBK7348520.1 hypothetical protein [Gemmatimonadota bacterium]MBK7714088.1 hypothetical protein [Gemmatimonadota bacterium]MBK7783148.1 hypothetical protein [Gemmatimonadota bacterium]MBK7924091.1 hypothetical protein [Gemmatimonadota bacterium]